jgi:hypothetical protein
MALSRREEVLNLTVLDLQEQLDATRRDATRILAKQSHALNTALHYCESKPDIGGTVSVHSTTHIPKLTAQMSRIDTAASTIRDIFSRVQVGKLDEQLRMDGFAARLQTQNVLLERAHETINYLCADTARLTARNLELELDCSRRAEEVSVLETELVAAKQECEAALSEATASELAAEASRASVRCTMAQHWPR